MARLRPSSPQSTDLSLPPPVYTGNSVRSQTPQSFSSNNAHITNDLAFRQNKAVKTPVAENATFLMAPINSAESQDGTHRPGSGSKVQTPRWPFADDQESSIPTRTTTPRIVATPPADHLDIHKPPPIPQLAGRKGHNGPGNFTDSTHRRVFSHNPNGQSDPYTGDRQARAVSMSMLDEGDSTENYQPLQYHHRALEDVQIKDLNNQVSRMTVGSEGSGSGELARRTDNLGPPGVRNSHIGGNLQRPDSGFSSTSDFRGRTNSPHLAPHGHSRGASRNSRSPDSRPLSHIDLLNVPYPQPPPSGAENLVNNGLRTVIGNNASLLSTRKTLDMYRANVKKTSDPAIQYEFAVFMIGAAREEGLELDSISDAGSTKSSGSIRNDLLKEAKQILQKLCDRSYPFAQYYLADGYASGLFNNGRPDLERSFPLFLAASKHGHAEAMYRTALCYEWGWGCRVDAAKAVQFYQHAASKNHPGAMLRLGRACLTGDMGLGKRYREGVRWLKRGAESADFQYNQAPYDLACLHESGYGADVFKDESYAAQLYTKAADLGHKEASFRLGEAYEYGQLSCPKDPALSIHFYTGAAENGHPQAQMALCAWYMVGVEHVLEKDESESYEWARKAAEQGLPKAQYTVGYFTEMGIGCRRDPLEANVWYVRAADQGEERAKHRIAAIRAAATGADPVTAAKKRPGVVEKVDAVESDKKKRFGIF